MGLARVSHTRRSRQTTMSTFDGHCRQMLLCSKTNKMSWTSEDEKILPDDDKIKAIVKLQPPKSKRQVRQILGYLGNNQKYLKNYQIIAQPITDLLHKAQPDKVRWGPKQQEAFDALKSILTTKPALMPPDHSAGYIIQCDSSDYGCGCCLLQVFEGKERVIAYASNKLLPNQSNWSVLEKEAGAIVWVLQKFENYVFAIEIQTDHRPLVHFKTLAEKSSRVARWILVLQKFDIKTSHLKWSHNV